MFARSASWMVISSRLMSHDLVRSWMWFGVSKTMLEGGVSRFCWFCPRAFRATSRHDAACTQGAEQNSLASPPSHLRDFALRIRALIGASGGRGSESMSSHGIRHLLLLPRLRWNSNSCSIGGGCSCKILIRHRFCCWGALVLVVLVLLLLLLLLLVVLVLVFLTLVNYSSSSSSSSWWSWRSPMLTLLFLRSLWLLEVGVSAAARGVRLSGLRCAKTCVLDDFCCVDFVSVFFYSVACVLFNFREAPVFSRWTAFGIGICVVFFAPVRFLWYRRSPLRFCLRRGFCTAFCSVSCVTGKTCVFCSVICVPFCSFRVGWGAGMEGRGQ